MMRTQYFLLIVALLSVTACTNESKTAEKDPGAPCCDPAAKAEAEAAAAAEPSHFGKALSDVALTPLSEIAEAPDKFTGKTIKTEGEIAKVCQKMGCWMELKAENVPSVRVPMAGHAFVIPKDASGKKVMIEGEVSLRELSDGEKEHLEAEGATATASRLQISATGVQFVEG